MRPNARTLKTVGSLVLLVVLALAATQLGGDPGPARTAGPVVSASVDPGSDLPWIDEADLPREAAEVLRTIDSGGPVDHPGKDGSTFSNFEGLLPDEPRGYYREYTVATPGSQDRGARRIVTGGAARSAYFWTDDHYRSFARIRR